MTNYLLLESKTWKHENNGLFDYNSKEQSLTKLLIHHPCSIFLNHDHCYIPDPEILSSSLPLLRISRNSSFFQLSPIAEDNSHIWQVVNSRKSALSGLILNEGQCLRLGKVRFKVKQVNTSQFSREKQDLLKLFYIENSEAKANFKVSESSVCRICLNSSETEEDPLISPCKCAGTMSLVHVSCLKQWINCRVFSRRTLKIMSFYSKDLECELCKSEISPTVTCFGRSFSLINFSPLKESSFVVLEEYSLETMSKKGLHLICLKEGQHVIIGRSQESDLKISDITVSRKHCFVTLLKNRFYLNDNHSKFGTLLQMKKNFIVQPGHPLSLQLGRTVFTVIVKTPFQLKNCCHKQRKRTTKISNVTQADGFENAFESAAFIANQEGINLNT
jgi:hypothetical protein